LVPKETVAAGSYMWDALPVNQMTV